MSAITKQEALEQLAAIIEDQKQYADVEDDHRRADDVLLDLIGDVEIMVAYKRIKKWYA
jgi:hypothetical protein